MSYNLVEEGLLASIETNVSNLRQVGMGLMYVADYDGTYPMMSSPSGTNPRTRWPDYIYSYVKNESIFTSPLAP